MLPFENIAIKFSQQLHGVPSGTMRPCDIKVEETECTGWWRSYVNNDMVEGLTLRTVICESIGRCKGELLALNGAL